MSKLVSVGYTMSLAQLDELWNYEMWLANMLMDLPLRSCTAKPAKSLENYPAMNPSNFMTLKEQVRGMWIFASHHFTFKNTRNGWGIFFKENDDAHTKPFTCGKSAVMGWLAKAPNVNECPTAHRYLRSPCGGETNSIYLGGPISFANFDQEDRVTCTRCASSIEPLVHKLAVSKNPKRKLVPGMEVLWSYCLNRKDKCAPNLYHIDEWQMKGCCYEGELPVAAVLNELDVQCSSQQSPSTSSKKRQINNLGTSSTSSAVKKRKVGGKRPLMTSRCVQSYKPCTYCGLNLPLTVKAGRKVNVKCHWALKHAVELCHEMGAQTNDEENPVSPKMFYKHLDKVDHIFNSLNDHCYKVVPACNYFEIMGIPLLGESASDEEKLNTFQAFIAEGKAMFQRYQVLYLKGITMPKRYEDLLKPEETSLSTKDSGYSKINWNGNPPPSNNFSLNCYDLSEDERKEHEDDIEYKLTNAVVGWMNV